MKTGWMIFWIWTAMVVAFAVGVVNSSLKANEFSGTDAEFSITAGWQISVQEPKVVTLEAADSAYFLFSQDGNYLFGTPETPPLDYGSNTYFSLKDKIRGTWVVLDGAPSVVMESEIPFSVVVEPTEKAISQNIVSGFAISLMIWGLGILFGWMVSKD